MFTSPCNFKVDALNGGLVNRDRLYALLRDMVDIYSPSGKEEHLARFLVDYCVKQGIPVTLRHVDESRFNLEISAEGATPELLFLGHIDTVPAFDIEEYSFFEENGLCRGLGTADMKGGCAALIEAFVTAFEGGFLPSNLLLSLVVGEEESGDGTEALLDAYQFRGALVAEPTGLVPCTSHYGYLETIITIFGYRRHAAMSDRESHAIRTMLSLLLSLETFIEASQSDTVLNIRDLHSSESGFASPDRCSATLDLHIVPGTDAARYARELDRFLSDQLSSFSISDYQLSMPFVADGYVMAESDPLSLLLKDVFDSLSLPWTPGSFRSHSDANLLRDAGCPPIILGPGTLSEAHTMNEFVEFDQVYRAADLYTRILHALKRA